MDGRAAEWGRETGRMYVRTCSPMAHCVRSACSLKARQPGPPPRLGPPPSRGHPPPPPPAVLRITAPPPLSVPPCPFPCTISRPFLSLPMRVSRLWTQLSSSSSAHLHLRILVLQMSSDDSPPQIPCSEVNAIVGVQLVRSVLVCSVWTEWMKGLFLLCRGMIDRQPLKPRSRFVTHAWFQLREGKKKKNEWIIQKNDSIGRGWVFLMVAGFCTLSLSVFLNQEEV